MSLTFRNLVLLALLSAIISTLSISASSHKRINNHMLRVHETSARYATHQQQNTEATAFVNNLQKIIQTIDTSIAPSVPAIIETKNLPAYSFSRTTCQNLKSEQKTQLINQINSTRQSITNLKTKTTDPKVTADADNSIQYLNVAQLLMNRNCQDIGTIIVGPSPYQTNINTQKPWILGGITLNDLVKDYVSRGTTYDNVTNCGLNTPFFTGLKCISCQNPKPIFDITKAQCTDCPQGQIYDQKTRSCVGDATPAAKIFKPNTAAESSVLVPAGAPADALKTYMNTGTQSCPADKPFVQNNVCIACPTDKKMFNVVTKQCQALTFKPNAAAEPSVLVPAGAPADALKTYMNTGSQVCPADKPFVQNNVCIGCSADKNLFNLVTKQCQAPPAKIFKPNTAAESSVLVPAGAPADALKTYMNTGTQSCPADKPFVQNNVCIACPTDKKMFNVVTKQCQALTFKPNAAAEPSVLVPAGAPADALKTYMNTGSQVCPADKPFVQNNVCIACPADKNLFNLVTKQCQAPPAKIFKPNTAAESSVLVPAGAPADALKTYMNTGTQSCPADKPFVQNNVCIACPTDKKMFNVVTKQCQALTFKPNAAAEPSVLVPAGAPADALKTYMNTGSQVCPADKPFVQNNVCIACPADKNLFNLVTKQCQAPPAKIFKPNTAAESSVLVPAGAPADALKTYMNTGTQSCPADKPFVQNNVCIACPTDKKMFNVVTKQCQALTFKPNAAAEPSVLVPAGAPADALKTYMNTGSQVCPADKPFVQNNVCIACPADKKLFNVVTKQCQAPVYKANPVASDSALVPAGSPADALKNYLNSGSQICPTDKPNVKDNTCIACPADKPNFNIIAKECQACAFGFVYDKTTHTCIKGTPVATDVVHNQAQLVMNDNSTSADWDKYVQQNQNKILCPTQNPFWNGKACIMCPELFNVILKTCVTCPEGLSLNTGSHKCETAKPSTPSIWNLFNAI